MKRIIQNIKKKSYFKYISKFEVPANNENNDYLKNVECNFVIEDL